MNNQLCLFVDYDHAFDYLAYLQIKLRKFGGEDDLDDFHRCKNILEFQIGEKLVNNIMRSKEYENLVSYYDKHIDNYYKQNHSIREILRKKYFKDE